MLSLIESLDRQDVEVFETNNPPPNSPSPPLQKLLVILWLLILNYEY